MKNLKINQTKFFFISVIILLNLSVFPEEGPLKISSFFDFYYASRQENAGEDGFETGQAELDLEKELKNFKISSSIVYLKDEKKLDIAVLTADLSLYDTERNKTRLLIGQFDVPFGISYLNYASNANPFVSLPLNAESGHQFWNDKGICLNSDFNKTGIRLFVVNGFDVFEEDRPCFQSKMAIGGRLAFRFPESMEAGFSTAEIDGKNDGRKMHLHGLDIHFTFNQAEIKAEWIQREIRLSGNSQGYYIEPSYSFKKISPAIRYEKIRDEDQDIRITSPCLRCFIHENFILKMEYQFHSGSKQDSFFLQTVITIGL